MQRGGFQRAAQRGICPVCESERALTRNGKVRRHPRPSGRGAASCSGSGSRPAVDSCGDLLRVGQRVVRALAPTTGPATCPSQAIGCGGDHCPHYACTTGGGQWCEACDE